MEKSPNKNIQNENNIQPNINEVSTQSPSIDNIFLFKDNSNTSLSNNSNKNDPFLKLNTNSLFAYQELDEFSSFCDSESNLANKNKFIDASNDTSIDSKLDEFSNEVQLKNKINNRRRFTYNNTLPTNFNNCSILLSKDQQNLLENIKKTNTNYLTSNDLNEIFNNHLKDMNDEYLKKNIKISDEFKEENNNDDKNNNININNNINQINNIKERKSQQLFQLGFYGYQNYNQLINQNHMIYYNNNNQNKNINNKNKFNKGMNNN